MGTQNRLTAVRQEGVGAWVNKVKDYFLKITYIGLPAKMEV